MSDRDVASHMLVWESGSDGRRIESLGTFGIKAMRRFFGRAWYRMTSRKGYVFRNQNYSYVEPGRLAKVAISIKPNLIIVHYISDFLSFDDLVKLQKLTGAKVVFHLLDMGMLTGGCHYSWGCRHYHDRCVACPALMGGSTRIASAQTLARKNAAVQNLDHIVVVPSTQLAHDAVGAAIFAKSRFKQILLGVDPELLGQCEQAAARSQLGLPLDGVCLFVGAQDLADPRKGVRLLLAALQLLDADGSLQRARVCFLIAGEGGAIDLFDAFATPTRRLGYVNAEVLALAYCASDFFVCPSIEDSGPMMVNEAMMSGTAVVGFAIGVLPDLVMDGETGALALTKDAKALAEAIGRALAWTATQRAASRHACRELAMKRCSLDVQVHQFIELAANLG